MFIFPKLTGSLLVRTKIKNSAHQILESKSKLQFIQIQI